MQIFINEYSLHEQYHEMSEFENAIKHFYSLFAYLNEKKVKSQIFKSEDLFWSYNALQSKLFIATLNSLPDKSLYQSIQDILFNALNINDWNKVRQHSADDVFIFRDNQNNEEIVTDTSIAELAERQLQNKELVGILVNFPKSKFNNYKEIPVIKNEDEDNPINLDCVDK